MWALVLLTVILTGCATTVGSIDPGHRLGATRDSIVVGRVEAIRPDGREIGTMLHWLLTGDPFRGHMVLRTVREDDGRTYQIKCDRTGYASDFYVSLPPGRYRITEWHGGNDVGRVRGWFDVVPRRVVYIGTLRFTDARREFLSHKGAWSTHDGSDDGLRAFRERYPALAVDVARSLIFSDPIRPRPDVEAAR